MKTTRKCRLCKQPIDIQGDDYLVQSNAFYHIDCWGQHKYASQRKQTKTLNDFMELARATGEESRAIVKHKIKEEETKNQLFQFISETYGIMNFPSYFYIKISQVLNGTRKGLMVAIPVEDLYDMWLRRMVKLNRINAQAMAKGKNIEGINRVYYDLGVLVGEYENYLKWKQKQTSIEVEKEYECKFYTHIPMPQQPITSNDDEVDIFSIIDEI